MVSVWQFFLHINWIIQLSIICFPFYRGNWCINGSLYTIWVMIIFQNMNLNIRLQEKRYKTFQVYGDLLHNHEESNISSAWNCICRNTVCSIPIISIRQDLNINNSLHRFHFYFQFWLPLLFSLNFVFTNRSFSSSALLHGLGGHRTLRFNSLYKARV